MPAAAQPTCFLIADISRYTGYLAGGELDHAQDILADLIGAIVTALRPNFSLAISSPTVARSCSWAAMAASIWLRSIRHSGPQAPVVQRSRLRCESVRVLRADDPLRLQRRLIAPVDLHRHVRRHVHRGASPGDIPHHRSRTHA